MNPQKSSKRKNHKVRGASINKTVALLVLFCLCIGGISLVSARYIKQRETNNNSAKASEFYFESDLLDGQTHEIIPTENNGTTASVKIRLMNYVDELRYSGTDIAYSVTVKEEGKDTQLAADNITNQTGTIATGEKRSADVAISNLEEGKTYIVTATTSNIYKKTLTGTIKVDAPDTQVHAEASDKNQYIEVTVWTTDYTGRLKLTYDNIGLIPDNTDDMMSDMQSTGGTITNNNWGANTSHVFRFFKTMESAKYQVTVDNESKEVTVSAVQ